MRYDEIFTRNSLIDLEDNIFQLPCEICGEYNMDYEACIVAIKNCELICVNCCGDCE